MQTPHDILGVATTASQIEIVSAYRTRAQIYHPDRWHDSASAVSDEAARLMRQLNEAYEMLTSKKSAPNGSAQRRWPTSASWNQQPPQRPAAQRPDASWDRAVRERSRRAAEANAARREKEASAVNGQAVPQPRGPRSPSAVHAGLGEALVTNRIPCRGCRSIQWLPEGWRARLDDVVYHCSVCQAVLLAHRPRT